MYRALVFKELRESAWIGLLAVAAYAVVIAGFMGYSLLELRWQPVMQIPFQNMQYAVATSLIAGACGLTLGFRQSAWESLRTTTVFLLHRPVSWRTIFYTKLATGLFVLLVATGLPLLAYALWAASPGTYAGPFYWSWTNRCWMIWFEMTIVYLAAFLSGIRPARWFGSRLLPLLGILVPVLAAWPISPHYGLRCLLVVIADAVLLSAIFHVVDTRDYP